MRIAQFITYLVCLICLPIEAQQAAGDTIWNQTDANGFKQGFWKKYYPDGTLMYRGFFRNDRPHGKMERFYEEGVIKAVIHSQSEDETSRVQFYFRNGQLGADGPYRGMDKDSIWNYYSYYTGKRTLSESYRNGELNGISVTYFPEGVAAELTEWKDNVKNGKWEQYYEDSKLRMVSSFQNGKIHGDYRVYNRNSVLLIEGKYVEGNLDGTWLFMDGEGNIEHELHYSNGKILNNEALEKWAEQYMKQVEDSLGTIPEPDLENIFR